MTITTLGTAQAAKLMLALAVTSSPTENPLPIQGLQRPEPINKTATRLAIQSINFQAATSVANEDIFDSPTRATSLQETLIGEIRSWSLLENDWDGEGSLKPVTQSINEAVSFIALLNNEIIVPEPMLLNSGHTALFWNEANLYADIEFLGDGRIAYFIKKNGDKHKGVLEFDSQEMPAVFQALIKC
jgi:hypothetical protein